MDNEINSQPKKLKPVVLVRSPNQKNAQNTTQQIMLLNALAVTSDPKKLKDMIGVKTVADVYRTLDKMAIRKEFHKALDRAGISFDFIVGGIRNIAAGAEKDGDRLRAFQMLLQTLGLDKYEEATGAGSGSWEEQVIRAVEKEKAKLPEGTVIKPTAEYEVIQPVVPESVKEKREKEKDLTETLYGRK